MAKVAFSKLDLKINSEVVEKTYITSKGEEIKYEILKYLPYEQKLDLVSRIINQSVDTNNFYNPMRVQLFTVIEMVYAYTNFNFTAKMKEDILKLYDLLIQSGIFQEILNTISEKEWKDIYDNVQITIDNIYKYQNSAMGVMEMISTDYSNLDLDITNLSSKLADSTNIEFLRDVMNKLG